MLVFRFIEENWSLLIYQNITIDYQNISHELIRLEIHITFVIMRRWLLSQFINDVRSLGLAQGAAKNNETSNAKMKETETNTVFLKDLLSN